MTTLKITTDNKVSVIDLDFKDFKAIQRELGEYFECVKTQRLRDYFKAPVMMLVDEDGVIKGLPFNAVASAFYGFDKHGCIIAGDIILGLALGRDIVGLGNSDSEQWMKKLLKDFSVLERGNVK